MDRLTLSLCTLALLAAAHGPPARGDDNWLSPEAVWDGREPTAARPARDTPPAARTPSGGPSAKAVPPAAAVRRVSAVSAAASVPDRSAAVRSAQYVAPLHPSGPAPAAAFFPVGGPPPGRGYVGPGACCDAVGCPPGNGGYYCNHFQALEYVLGHGFFAGVEYLAVRPSVSDGSAFVVQNGGSNTVVEHDFDYDDGVRAYFGYRLNDCDGEVRFVLTSFNGSSGMESTATGNTRLLGHLGTQANPGQTLSTYASVDARTYDIDFEKTLFFGQPLGCCPNACGGCSPWDLSWLLGVRIADVDWDQSSSVTGGSRADSTMGFNGAGPRLGVEGRRHFGPCGCWWLFARGSISLLLGEADFVSTQVDASGATTTQRASFTRTVPVTEMEIGGSWRYSAQTMITAGYLFQAWHDLGLHNGIEQLPLGSYDDADILSFDGVFVRLHLNF